MSEKNALIFDVTQSNFEQAVIKNSYELPVFALFVGQWSGPCVQMAEELKLLGQEFASEFVVAQIDIDEQPELLQQFKIDNVPTLKVFRQGVEVQSEEGQLRDEDLRIMLRANGNIFSQSEDLRLQARQKHLSGQTTDAILLLTQAIQSDPSNIKVAMDMVQVFIDLGELQQAKGLFNKLPNSAKENDVGKQLLGQLTFLDLASKTKGIEALSKDIEKDSSNCDAHFDLALCFVAENDYDKAVDSLLEILKHNANYKGGAAKEMIIFLSDLIKDNNAELAASFRRRLASFS